MIEKYMQHDSQDAETRKMSHSFFAVQENTSILERDIKELMEVVLAQGEEQVILQCAPPL